MYTVKRNKHTLTAFIDLEKEPKQRLAILSDCLFSVRCPACKKQYTVMHELLVIDESTTMAMMFIPDTSFEEVEGSMAERTTLLHGAEHRR